MYVGASLDTGKTDSRLWPSVVFAPLIIPVLFIAEGVFLERIDDVGLFVFMALGFSLPLSYAASLTLGFPRIPGESWPDSSTRRSLATTSLSPKLRVPAFLENLADRSHPLKPFLDVPARKYWLDWEQAG